MVTSTLKKLYQIPGIIRLVIKSDVTIDYHKHGGSQFSNTKYLVVKISG